MFLRSSLVRWLFLHRCVFLASTHDDGGFDTSGPPCSAEVAPSLLQVGRAPVVLLPANSASTSAGHQTSFAQTGHIDESSPAHEVIAPPADSLAPGEALTQYAAQHWKAAQPAPNAGGGQQSKPVPIELAQSGGTNIVEKRDGASVRPEITGKPSIALMDGSQGLLDEAAMRIASMATGLHSALRQTVNDSLGDWAKNYSFMGIGIADSVIFVVLLVCAVLIVGLIKSSTHPV